MFARRLAKEKEKKKKKRKKKSTAAAAVIYPRLSVACCCAARSERTTNVSSQSGERAGTFLLLRLFSRPLLIDERPSCRSKEDELAGDGKTMS